MGHYHHLRATSTSLQRLCRGHQNPGTHPFLARVKRETFSSPVDHHPEPIPDLIPSKRGDRRSPSSSTAISKSPTSLPEIKILTACATTPVALRLRNQESGPYRLPLTVSEGDIVPLPAVFDLLYALLARPPSTSNH